MQDHCKPYTTSKAKLKDLIQKVLRHPDFDPDQVDHDMHKRLMQAIEEEDILIWDKWEEGDGISIRYLHRYRNRYRTRYHYDRYRIRCRIQ